MNLFASTYTEVPQVLITLLQQKLPQSLPLLRRLQNAKLQGSMPPTARVVMVSAQSDHHEAYRPPDWTYQPGMAGYVDFGGGPATQMWIFTTFETRDMTVPKIDKAVREKMFEAFLSEVTIAAKDHLGDLYYPGSVLVGSLDSRTRAALERKGRVTPRPTGEYDKWIFDLDRLPKIDPPLPKGMQWSEPNEADYHLVVSRTDISRTPDSLRVLQGLMIKLEDQTPVAWAFLGHDGSLVSVHCEEPYRRKGLARLLTAKLLRDRARIFGDAGLACADVSPDNAASRGMCRKLKGRPEWIVSWVLLDVRESNGEAAVAGDAGSAQQN